MSDYTRDELIAAIEDEAEATGSSRWSTTVKLQRLDWVFTQEWHKILAANPMYRWALRTPTADANGQVLYAALDNPNPPTGNSQERFHRVLAVARDDTLYTESDFNDHPLLISTGVGPLYRWWQEGDHLALPLGDANASMKVWVNHTPCPPSKLAAGTDLVTFPRGFSGVLVHEGAASLLAKGGAETEAAIEEKQLADLIRREMLSQISRRSTKPLSFAPVDTAESWGAR